MPEISSRHSLIRHQHRMASFRKKRVFFFPKLSLLGPSFPRLLSAPLPPLFPGQIRQFQQRIGRVGWHPKVFRGSRLEIARSTAQRDRQDGRASIHRISLEIS